MALHRFLPAGLVALSLSLAACSNGPGTQAELVAALTRGDTFTQPQAQCIAKAVFDKYGADKTALNKISKATSYDDLVNNGVPGFGDFFTTTVNDCQSAT